MGKSYAISINGGKEGGGCKYEYKYKGKGNSIELTLYSSNQVFVEFKTDAEILRNAEFSFESPYLIKVLQNAHLAFALRYGKKLKVNTISVNGKELYNTVGENSNAPIVYSMLGDKFRLADAWKEKTCVEQILSALKNDRRIPAVYAFLASTGCGYEVQKFMCLWASMNCYYKYTAYLDAQRHHTVPDTRDAEQIKILLRQLHCGDRLMFAKERNLVATKEKYAELMKILAHETKNGQAEQLYNICWTEVQDNQSACYSPKEEIEGLDVSRLKTLGILLLEFPYYLRCNYFHGNKPVLLFSTDTNTEMNMLKTVNYFLYRFLNEHIPQMFSETVLKGLSNEAVVKIQGKK